MLLKIGLVLMCFIDLTSFIVFLTSFNVYFVCGCACFMRICLKTAIWVSLAFLGEGLAFCGEDRLATLLCSLARFDLANRGVCQPVQPHTYARLLVFDETLAQPHFAAVNFSDAVMSVLLPFFNTQPKFCSYELLCRSIEHIFLQYPTRSADSLYSL